MLEDISAEVELEDFWGKRWASWKQWRINVKYKVSIRRSKKKSFDRWNLEKPTNRTQGSNKRYRKRKKLFEKGTSRSREEPPPEKLTKFHKIQINFHDSENDNNEENRLRVKDSNIENSNNEDNRLSINGSYVENGSNKSTVKSN